VVTRGGICSGGQRRCRRGPTAEGEGGESEAHEMVTEFDQGVVLTGEAKAAVGTRRDGGERRRDWPEEGGLGFIMATRKWGGARAGMRRWRVALPAAPDVTLTRQEQGARS
jgi:hypothetical protein